MYPFSSLQIVNFPFEAIIDSSFFFMNVSMASEIDTTECLPRSIFPDDDTSSKSSYKVDSNHERQCSELVERETSNEEEGLKERLTLEDCVDMDVDVLTTVLERNFQSLKRDTLEFFVEARSRFKSRALNELTIERREAERRYQVKAEEIKILENELRKEKESNARHLEALERMAEAVGLAHRRKRSFVSLLIVFLSWVQYTQEEKHLRRQLQVAVRYDNESRLKRKALRKWVEQIRQQIRNGARERFNAKLSVATITIESQFVEKLKALEEENIKLKEKVKTEVDVRMKLEEDMQQAFMRGVCALNMEALTVMKRGFPSQELFLNAKEIVPSNEAEDVSYKSLK